MKKIQINNLILITFFTLFILFPFVVKSDLGNPDIQAICQITLKDGKIIEGIILMANGGYQLYLDTNGFYIIADNPPHGKLKRAVLFNLRFQGIFPYKGKTFRGRSSSTNPTLANNPKVYYLHDITSKKYYIHDTKIKENLKTDQKLLILSRKITHNLVYELRDYIPVYLKLPDVVYLESGYKQKEKIIPIQVPVEKIEKFELLVNPPQKWLEDIAEKTRTWEEKYGLVDSALMVEWYHELIKRPKEEREYFKKIFKPWEF